MSCEARNAETVKSCSGYSFFSAMGFQIAWNHRTIPEREEQAVLRVAFFKFRPMNQDAPSSREHGK